MEDIPSIFYFIDILIDSSNPVSSVSSVSDCNRDESETDTKSRGLLINYFG